MAISANGFRSLIDNSPDAISVLDTRGKILFGSPSTAAIFGYRPEELVGHNYLDLIHPQDRDRSSRALEDVLGKPLRAVRWEARARRGDDNYFWTENTFSNMPLEDELPAIVLHQWDITARKLMEEERQRSAEELVRCNRRLEEFAYTAAHDLRGPLRAISVYADLLVQQTPVDAIDRKMARFIVDGVAQMSALVDDLLSFAATGVRKPSRYVDLRRTVTHALRNLAAGIQAGGAIVKLDPLPVVRGNEVHLVRLFQNLISNAVKYRSEDPVEIHVTARQRGPDWIVGVRDNGVGIPPEYHARVFMPFERLAGRDIPGTGLGLAVCKKIVEELGGELWLESQPGAGSTFFFTIMGARELKTRVSLLSRAETFPLLTER